LIYEAPISIFTFYLLKKEFAYVNNDFIYLYEQAVIHGVWKKKLPPLIESIVGILLKNQLKWVLFPTSCIHLQCEYIEKLAKKAAHPFLLLMNIHCTQKKFFSLFSF